MFSLIDFTREWASAYKPMLHGLKDKRGRIRKRFFCIESIGQIANFAKELPSTESPFVAIETNIGGNLTSRYVYPEYNVYFFVMGKGKLQNNDEDDTEAKMEAMRHASAFLSFLNRRKEEVSVENVTTDGIHTIDTDNAHFETFGPFMNRWFCVGVSFMGLEKFACFNPQDYVSPGEEGYAAD